MREALLLVLAAFVGCIAASGNRVINVSFKHRGMSDPNQVNLASYTILDAIQAARTDDFPIHFPLPKHFNDRNNLIKILLAKTLIPHNKENPKQAAAIMTIFEDAGYGIFSKNRRFDLNLIKPSPVQMAVFMQLASIDSRSIHPLFRGKSIIDYIQVDPFHALVTAMQAAPLDSIDRQTISPVFSKRELREIASTYLDRLKYTSDSPLVIERPYTPGEAFTKDMDIFDFYNHSIPICLHPSMILPVIAIARHEVFFDVLPRACKITTKKKLPVITELLQPVDKVARRLDHHAPKPSVFGCFIGNAAQQLAKYIRSGDADFCSPAYCLKLLQWLKDCEDAHNSQLKLK